MSNTTSAVIGKLLMIAATSTALFSGQAQAVSLLGQAPDPSVIVNAGGLEWVYAAPCAGESPSCGVVQLHHDFNFATASQWNLSFATIDALVAAFTLPNGGVRCAATYFSTAHDHCDFGDVSNGFIWHSPLAPDEAHSLEAAAETFLVRASNGNNVPEPESLALLGLGLAGLAATRRRKSK